MRPRERGTTVEYRFRAAPERVWQALADTARYNEAAGFPMHRITTVTQDNGSQQFRGEARVGPLRLAWNDLPCNWVRDRWFEHTRLFEGGPLRRLTARLDLVPEAAGCTGTYRVAVEPRGLAGAAVIGPTVVTRGVAEFKRLAVTADAWACDEREAPFEMPTPKLPAETSRRAERIGAELTMAGHPPALIERLMQLVLTGAENDVTRLRPLALARWWGASPDIVVRLCLDATRRGLLALHWDLLCPRCRGAKLRAAALDELPRGAHCPTCAVDYDRDFSRNVEATFSPAEAIRPLAGGEFCLLGPMSTPHILAHLTVGPGETLEPGFVLPPGSYRFRTLEPGPELVLDHAGGTSPTVRYTEDAITAEAGSGTLTMVNASPELRTLVIEDRAWIADALTGDRLTSLQSFRDLFSDQVLRPGDEVGIERVAILFSDLRGSTALYERLGDAGAYQRVREHFGYLTGLVRQHGGAVVKTIGDAVMAVFADPARGAAAALAMQQHIEELNRDSAAPLSLKVGIHAGACIAVTLNDRLDYFGRTVNLAARLQGQSRAGEVVISEELTLDPEVSPLLAGHAGTREEVALRGFSAPVRFLRLMPGRPAG